MSHVPYNPGPRSSGPLPTPREVLRAIGVLIVSLWRFLTRTTVGIVAGVLLVLGATYYAAPRIAVLVKPYFAETDDGEAEGACYALLVEARESCLDDPDIIRHTSSDPDALGVTEFDRPERVIEISDELDGYIPGLGDPDVQAWQVAQKNAANDAERARRQCFTHLVAERWGARFTFIAYSGNLARHTAENQLGALDFHLVKLAAPDYGAIFLGESFAPYRPARLKESCGD
jgi:hypothetical protein